MSDIGVLVSCEHASGAIPELWAPLFADAGELLASHHGMDPGALVMAEKLAVHADGYLMQGQWSRLLVDLNRSPDNARRFSARTRRLESAQREVIDAAYHRPYQQTGAAWIADALARRRRVLHVSVHTFTPVLNDRVRNTDIGLLHLTGRKQETRLAQRWQVLLRRRLADLRVHRNQPYAGNSDGYVPHLAQRFSEPDYCGLELEINQRIVFGDAALWARVQDAVAGSFLELLAGIRVEAESASN